MREQDIQQHTTATTTTAPMIIGAALAAHPAISFVLAAVVRWLSIESSQEVWNVMFEEYELISSEVSEVFSIKAPPFSGNKIEHISVLLE